MSAPVRVRRILSRVIFAMMVALSVETLVLAFRLGRKDALQLTFVLWTAFTAFALLAAWGAYVWLYRSAEELELTPVQAAEAHDATTAPVGQDDR